MEIQVKNLFVSVFYFTHNPLAVVTHTAIWLKKNNQLPFVSLIASFFYPEKLHGAFKHMKTK